MFRPVGTQDEIVATPAYVGPPYSLYWGGYYGYGWGMPWYGPEIRTYTVVSVETLAVQLGTMLENKTIKLDLGAVLFVVGHLVRSGYLTPHENLQAH